MNATTLLPLVRELFSRLPEMRSLQAWELQSALFVLGYTDELEEAKARTEGMLTLRKSGVSSTSDPTDPEIGFGARKS